MTWSTFATSDLISNGYLEIGDGYRAKNSEMAEEGVPFVRAGDVDGRVNTSGTDLLSPASVEKIGRKHSMPGDVVMTTKGTIGRLAFVKSGDPDFIYSPQLCFWRSLQPDLIDPRWLFFAMRSQEMLNQISWSAGQTDMAPYVSLIDQRTAFKITLPPINEQRAIASILGALDDKIELNRRMSATLEDMARSLYKSWFVDFDPVHAKMEGRQPAFMDEATAALFPDRFGDDGLPEGWIWEPIGNHFHAQKGLSYKGAGLCAQEEGLPLHNLNSVLEGGGYKYAGIKYYNGDFKDRNVVNPGDLIVANTEQGFDHMLIGHSAIIPRSFGPMGLFSHHLFKVTPLRTSWLSREWLYLALSVAPMGTVVRSFSNGTTVNMLPADAFEIPLIVLPTRQVVERFDDLIALWFERRDEAINQVSTLSALRDSLLPKLMSGEIRVGEAREQIEEVA